jgi:hypothetical protein
MGEFAIVGESAMANTNNHQLVKPIFPLQANGAAGSVRQRFGEQDKTALTRGSPSSRQPEPSHTPAQSHAPATKTPRTKKHGSSKRKTVHLVLWVKPIVKADIKRIADQEGISLSKAAGTLLARALDGYMDRNYHALLDPMIKTSVQKHMAGGFNRLAWLLVRIAFAAEQDRALTTNILGRMPDVTPEQLKHILTMSQKAAKGNISRTSPEMQELIDAVETFLSTETVEEQASNY